MDAIVTFDQIKHYLGLSENDVTDYPHIEVNMELVHAAIEGYCGRRFKIAATNVTKSYYLHEQTSYIYLETLPVTSVNSFTIDGQAVDSSLYNIVDYGLLLGYKVNHVDIAIDYDGGYSSYDSVPKELQKAEIMQIAHEYQRKDSIGSERVSTEGGVIDSPSIELLPAVKELLSPYKHIQKITTW